LTAATRYQTTTSYSYSNAGAFTSNSELAGQWQASADTSTGLLPAGTDANPFTYDDFGRLSSSPEIASATYDAKGQLLTVQTKSGQKIAYGYGPDGARYYKQVTTGTGTAAVTRDSYYPVKSYSEEPSGAQSFTFVGDKRIVRFDHGQGSAPDTWFYYLSDHLGSHDIMMNADGKPVEQILYFPYGSEVQASKLSAAWTSYLAANAAIMPVDKTHYRFTGQYLDDETGLYYFGARYYHPKLGRFVTPDPLYLEKPEQCEKSAIDCGLYAYARNNPLSYVDPDGHEPVEIVAGGGAAVYILGGALFATAMWYATPEGQRQSRSAGEAFKKALDERVDVAKEKFAAAKDWVGHLLSENGSEAAGESAGEGAETEAGEGAAKQGKGGGRGSNNLRPDANAEGDHSTFKTDPQGKVTNYAEWEENPRNPSGFDEVKRLDKTGGSHFDKATGQDVPTPHVHEGGGVRPALPEEIPK
jgi:RHS repeat-associated protein